MVQLSDELLGELDAEARRSGSSRSSLIRDAIRAYLDERGRVAAIARYVEGYRRWPPSPDEWGDLEADGDRQGHELALRLEAEERAIGASW
jgi:hypothetical protein